MIDLLRHGEVVGEKKLLGITDSPLSFSGWQRMSSHTQTNNPLWQKIITSDLQRCRCFAEHLAEKHSSQLEITPQFRELNFGDWDGELLDDLYNGISANQLSQFIQSPSTITPPNGETYAIFKKRVLTAWQQLMSELMSGENEHYLLITHGGVIKTILADILGITENHLLNIEVPYACLSRVTYYQGCTPNLTFHNGQLKP